MSCQEASSVMKTKTSCGLRRDNVGSLQHCCKRETFVSAKPLGGGKSVERATSPRMLGEYGLYLVLKDGHFHALQVLIKVFFLLRNLCESLLCQRNIHDPPASLFILTCSILYCHLCLVCSKLYHWEQGGWQETPGEERECRRGWCRGNKETNTVPWRRRADETKMMSASGTWSDNTEKH